MNFRPNRVYLFIDFECIYHLVIRYIYSKIYQTLSHKKSINSNDAFST